MHGFANPARFLRLARWLTPFFLIAGLVLTGAALVWGLLGAPAERLQGESVRILFVHVPAAWLGMGGWTALAMASLTELVWRHPLAGHCRARHCRARRVLHRAVPRHRIAVGPPGLGHLVGVGWAADLDVGAAVPLFRLYRAGRCRAARDGENARVAAIFGLVGAINIPIINRSVVWWNSLHQPPSITVGKSAMAPAFLCGLLAATIGFSLLFGAVVLMRMRTILADSQAEARLRRRALEHADA